MATFGATSSANHIPNKLTELEQCLKDSRATQKRGKRKERCKLLYWLYNLCLIAIATVLKDSPAPLEQCLKDSRTSIKGSQMLKFELRKSSASSIPHQMINDQDLGFISNFLGIFIPLLVTAYHYVIADLKCKGSSKDQAGTCCDRCLMVFSNEDRSEDFFQKLYWLCILHEVASSNYVFDSDKHRVIE